MKKDTTEEKLNLEEASVFFEMCYPSPEAVEHTEKKEKEQAAALAPAEQVSIRA